MNVVYDLIKEQFDKSSVIDQVSYDKLVEGRKQYYIKTLDKNTFEVQQEEFNKSIDRLKSEVIIDKSKFIFFMVETKESTSEHVSINVRRISVMSVDEAYTLILASANNDLSKFKIEEGKKVIRIVL